MRLVLGITGVPEIIPVNGLIESPKGNVETEDILKFTLEGVVIGLIGVIGEFCVNTKLLLVKFRLKGAGI